MPNMLQLIKQAAVEAVEAANPSRVLYGTVTKASPLAIRIDQKFTITKEFLVVSRSVSDYETTIEIDGSVQTVKIKNGLKTGDRVILLQEQGGQRYVVMDKVGGTS